MKKQFLGTIAIALLCLSTHASEIPYNFAEVGYSSVDTGDTDGDGFKIAGSFALADNIYTFGDYASYSLDNSTDFTYLGLGLGYYYSIQPNVDLQLDLAFRGADLDRAGTSVDLDENGYEIGLGVRSMLQNNLEVGARIESVNIDGNDTFFELNGTYYFANGFGVSGELSFGDDFDFYGLKARYRF